jgi:hypothetical protein
MIKFKELKVNITSFNIYPFQEVSKISMADSDESYIQELGGIKANLFFEKEVGNEGWVTVSQVCKNHKLAITFDDDHILTFSTEGKRFLDSPNPKSPYYKTYNVGLEENEIRVEFFDCLFFVLESNFKSVDYSIEFEIWIQICDSDCRESTIKPVLKFIWKADFQVVLVGKNWQISHSITSSSEEIEGSIQNFDKGSPPLLASTFPHLLTAVKEFKRQNINYFPKQKEDDERAEKLESLYLNFLNKMKK